MTALVLAGMGVALIAALWGLWRASLIPPTHGWCEVCQAHGPIDHRHGGE